MAKPKRRKASLHSAGKVQEQDILARARALADDPHLAEPICEGGCVFFSPAAAARRGIAKAHAARDDEAKLTRLAASGNELAVAYAATLLVAKADKVPYIGEIRLGGMVAPYVARGKAKPLFLAGLQNHTDRQLRLLAVAPWVKKRGMHFYSADRGIVCTGRRAAPPRDFVEEEMEALDLSPDGDGRFSCGHKDRDTVILTWRDANAIKIERCAECCAGADGVPTLHAIVRHMAVPEAMAGFDVGVRLAPLVPPVDVDVELSAQTKQQYAAGLLSDAQLLEAGRAGRVDALKALDRRVFVAGDRSFGEDIDAFVRALSATPAEERALRAALAAQTGPVVLDKASSARALAELWPAHGRAMLEAAAGDPAVAARLHKDRVTSEDATELIRRAEREGSHQTALATLPRYQNLPPQAAAMDHVARAFRTGGQDAAVRAALERASSAKAKGAALAFLDALGAAKGQEWRFAQSDRDVAASVAPAVERLLRGPAEGYHAALREASLRAGETAAFEPQKGGPAGSPSGGSD